MLAELNEVLDQLQRFCGTLRRISRTVPYHPLFFSGCNVIDVAHTAVIWGCSYVFFIQSIHCLYCFTCAQFIWIAVWDSWVENESVDKDYPQKTILEIH